MITFANLSLTIHGTPILRDVSFRIARGQSVGLVGESGSGKSMTALSLMRLLPRGSVPTGRILWNDTNILTRTEGQMCDFRGNQVGMIFQEPMTALNPVQKIGDQVAETLLIHGKATRGEARKVALEKLDRVGLSRFGPDRYPHELSGGQRQRVCIAMAIALRPELLIADEPTTALDVTTQAQILDLLKGLVEEEKMSLLLISHDLAVVASMTQHVAVMQHGRIVEQNDTDALFRTMQHPYTRQLFEASGHQPHTGQMAPSDAFLQVNDVVRTYPGARRNLIGRDPDHRAVDGVSFAIRRGESLGLVGESGCGKSTLTRAILGLEALQGGEILLDGQAVRAGQAMPADMRQKMQVVFQDPYASFNPRHKVRRLICEPFYLSGLPDDAADRVSQVLVAVGLNPADADKYIHEFSGGQRQRIAIARALITRPELIVLDEAVSALDVRVRAQILDLLAELRRDFGLTYLFISHDLSVVRSITDRVLVMRNGKIVEHGPTKDVFDTPRNDYTRTLIDAAPRLPDHLTAGGADERPVV